MFRKTKSTNAFMLLLPAVLLLLTACGNATDTPVATTASQTTTGATTAAQTASVTTVAQTSGSSTNAPTTGVTSAPQTSAAAATTTARTGTTASAASCNKLNLNSLTENQLTATIPNFPNRMVREFLEYRPYTSIQQFRKEIGKYVDAAQVTEWEKYVYVPVDTNKSDVETLKQLPGVDNTVAAALTTGRPYASSAAFQQILASKVSAQQLASASCFIGA